MADKLILVATRASNATNIAAVKAVPIQGGWDDGVVWGPARVWGFWTSTALAETRQQLIALRDAGRIRLAVWEPDGESVGSVRDETQEQFIARCRTAAAGA